jgi:hypothetical protein
MNRRRIAWVVGAALVAAAGAWAWHALRPEPPPPPPAADRAYEDIDRSEYEQWMQDLGYTE